MRLSLIVASSALFLAVAAVPGGPKMGYDLSVFDDSDRAFAVELAGAAPVKVAAHYPPCRRGRTDDRCIQLYERRVRAAYANRGGSQVPVRAAPAEAIGGPIESRSDYPSCSRALTDECIQRFDSAARMPASRRAPPPEGASTPGI
jgi:hypothetical protein